MAGITYHNIHRSRPTWLHDSFSNENLLPNGVNLRKGSQSGTVKSGTYVARHPNANDFEVVSSGGATSRLVTSLAEPAASDDTTFYLVTVDGYQSGDSIEIDGTSFNVSSVDEVNDSIQVDAANQTSSLEAGVSVMLASAVSMEDHHLLASTVTDMEKSREGVLLRHGRMVYKNFLPQWESELDDAAKSEIEDKYQAIRGRL